MGEALKIVTLTRGGAKIVTWQGEAPKTVTLLILAILRLILVILRMAQNRTKTPTVYVLLGVK